MADQPFNAAFGQAQQQMQNCTAARTLTRVPVDAVGGDGAAVRLVPSSA